MEPLLLYFLKANGLLVFFYAVYYFLLQKETFFQANRWFLVFGIFVSFILPFITYSKIIWVEPTSIPTINLENFPTEIVQNTVTEAAAINWFLIFLSIYIGIITLFFGKLLIELFSFKKIISKGNKHKEHKIIWTENNVVDSPFSFFNYLVYNSEKFTSEELQQIFIHEKIHIQQQHTFDVLISKLATILLWVNPFVWLYRKAILQNLEFIADAKTTQTEDLYSYQKVLLKSVINHQPISITNQFYQSLIKKRIVMLHKKSSNQKNVWKYSIIFPVLIAFFMTFQVKTVAQVKTALIETENQNEAKAYEVIEFIINKNTTDEEIKKETEWLKKEHNIELKVSKIKRNKNNEIYAIDLKYKDINGKVGRLTADGDDPIQPIRFYKEKDENGKGTIGFGGESMASIFKNEEFFNIYENEQDFNTQTVGTIKTDKGKIVYNINGKDYTEEELKKQNIKNVSTDGSILYLTNENDDDKTIIFKGNAEAKDKNDRIIILNDKVISNEELEKVDVKTIKSVNFVTKEPKTFIIKTEENDKPVTYEYKVCDDEKTKISYEITTENNQKVILINTEDGDQNIIFQENMLKIPDVPSIRIENGKQDIYVNGKKLKNAEDFLTMNHLNIYYLEATETETTENGVIIVKRIDVKTR